MAEIEEATTPGEAPEATVPSSMTIDISSNHNLELTLTKTCLEVLYNLSAAFASAMQPELQVTAFVSPYKFKNESGLTVTLLLTKGNLLLFGEDSKHDIILETGAEANLYMTSDNDTSTGPNLSETDLLNVIEQEEFHVLVKLLPLNL